MKKKKMYFRQYFRCVITYIDVTSVRTLHYAVDADCLDNFVDMILDTFVHPSINFTDIIYSVDNREFFQLI